MQNVLVVDDEKTLLMIMTGRFEDYKDRFNVYTAGNGKEAVKVLESEQIDLVVTDLKMPEMDGIELIAYLSNKFPNVPSIAVSAYCTPEIQSKLKGLGALQVMDKPVNLDLLAEAVLKGLDQAHEGGSLNCVSLSSFLQIIEMEEKSCRIDVHANSKQRGSFFLVGGELYDAVCGNLKGEAAAYEMIGWDNTHLYIKELPRKTPEKQIEKGLMSVVMEGLRIKDEVDMEKDEKAASGEIEAAAGSNENTLAEGNKPPDNSNQQKQPPVRKSNVKVIKAGPDDPGPIFGPEDDTFTSELDNVLDILSEDPAVVELKEESPPPEAPPGVDVESFLLPADIVEAARTCKTGAEVVSALIQKAGTAVPVDVAILLSPVEGRTDGLRITNLIYSDQRIVATSTIMPLANSRIAQVLERNVPAALSLADLETGCVEQKLLDRLNMKSCLMVPLTGDGSSPVLLILASRQDNQFSDGGPQLEWITGGLSLALEKGPLQKSLSGHRQTAEVVQHIAKSVLSGAMEMEPLLKYLMDRIRKIFQVEAASLYLKEKDHLKVAMAFNTITGSAKKFQLKIGQGIAGTVAAKGKSMIVNDAQKSDIFFPDIDKQTGFTTRSVLCVPLVAYKKVIGILEILNKTGSGFSPEDEHMLQSITSALSIALVFKRSQPGR